MSVNEGPHMREYVGFIWVKDKPGIRLRVSATSSSDAKSRVVDEYGEGHVISIWNEEDAARPR